MPDPNENELKRPDPIEAQAKDFPDVKRYDPGVKRYDPDEEHSLADELAELSKGFPQLGARLAKYFDK